MSTRSYFMTTQYYNDFKPDHAWGQMLSVQVKQQLGNKLSVAASYAGFVRILSSDLAGLWIHECLSSIATRWGFLM